MDTIDIKDEHLTSLKDKVILVTGASSGIGLASAKLLLSHGAKLVVGDVNPCPISSSQNLTHLPVDVTDWASQLRLFKKAIELHGRIDHVFANAGIISMANYLEEHVDAHGDLLPPNNKTLDVNLMGVIYTCKLGIHYLKKNPAGGSVVITGSVASFAPFVLTDYGVSKHAVLGLLRGLHANLNSLPDNKIRINALAPMWTATGMVPSKQMGEIGVTTQGPDVVAKSAALLMADDERNGQVIYSKRGQYYEIGGPVTGHTYELLAPGTEDIPQGADNGRKMVSLLMNPDSVSKV